MWKIWGKTTTFKQEKDSTQGANKTGAESTSGVSNLKIQNKKESIMEENDNTIPVRTLYEITGRIPIPNRKADRWDFIDDLKIGDSMPVKNYSEVAAIRYRMRKNNKNITSESFKYDNEAGFVRVWRTK